MNSIDILEELKEWFNNFDLDSIKHKPEEYIQAISTLIAENKELKEKNKELEEEDVKIRAKFILQLDNYILKSKVEQKINELEEMSISQEIYYEDILKILQSLLEKE